MHYIFAVDHGWELRIFNKDELVFEYKCDWTDDIQIEKNLYDIALIRQLITEQGNSAEDIESLFDLNEDVFTSEEPPAHTMAQKLGLVNYEWISADYLDRDELDQEIVVVQ
ncbi:hypothetical protein [Paenibacillus sp. sgz302251]|uniref:hypothetical protein n=1 Tax=Paenibacillus sp. sgz302251 TaxID=3414493 RepID=UPI003C7C2FAF